MKAAQVRHRRLWHFLVLLFVVRTSPAQACLWDCDTPRNEAKGLPEATDVIIGWFDRYPPLYYQMRLDRVKVLIQKEPGNLEAYDDAAVACDRLHDDDKAIEWIEKKRVELDKLPPDSANAREHRYRYLANVGTFWVHRWIRQGADRTRIAEVRTARDFIAAAIKLNPDAHFGREKYQLMAMEWILYRNAPSAETSPLATTDPATQAKTESKPDVEIDNFLMIPFGGVPMDPDWAPAWSLAGDKATSDNPEAMKNAAKGIMGLIVLGDAWESVDAYLALALAIGQIKSMDAVAVLAKDRALELARTGKTRSPHYCPGGKLWKRKFDPRMLRYTWSLRV